jgi:hypothetical protein
VDTGAHVNPDRGVISVGIALAFKGLDVPVTALVDVIDDPGLLALPSTDPTASAD